MLKKEIKRKIGIVGFADSGKTVLLTSLINHLDEHVPRNFSLGKGGMAQVLNFKELSLPKDSLGETFPSSKYRKYLVEKKGWPEKTCVSYELLCSFTLKEDEKMIEYEIHFFDFPGERTSDVAIAECNDYAVWSDGILGYYKEDRCLSDEIIKYRKASEETSATLSGILKNYRQYLAKRSLAFRPVVTPSTFLLNEKGRQPDSMNLAGTGVSGLMPTVPGGDRQFAPLSALARAEHPEIARLFELHFTAYRNEVVLPVFSRLQDCNSLLIMFDIPGILVTDVERYNDIRESLNRFTNYLIDTRRKGLPSILWGPGNLDRVAFAAAKLDLVHKDDQKNMESLLEEMSRKFVQNLSSIHKKIKVQYFTFSAIDSTTTPTGKTREREVNGRVKEREMFGIPHRSGGKQDKCSFWVSAVPENWPEKWARGYFRYEAVDPVVPSNIQKAPEQINLNRLFSFLIGMTEEKK